MSEQLAKIQLQRYVEEAKAKEFENWRRNLADARQPHIDAIKRRAFAEAMNEPAQLPSIQSAQTDAGQFDLQAPNPGAAQPNEAIYNPFAGQYYIDEQGRKIERNPSNSSLRTGP